MRGSHVPICSNAIGNCVRAFDDASSAISRPRQSSSVNVPAEDVCSSLEIGSHQTNAIMTRGRTRAQAITERERSFLRRALVSRLWCARLAIANFVFGFVFPI